MLHPLHLKMLEFNSYKKSKIKKSISGTSFLAPTQKIILASRYESIVDPEKKISSAIGTGVHKAYEDSIPIGFKFEYNGDEYELIGQEVSMKIPIGETGFHGTGTADLIFLKNGKIIHIGDIKTCKDWIFKNKNFSKWVQQLSIYSLLAKFNYKKNIDKKGTIFYYNKTNEVSGKVPLGHKEFNLLNINDTKKLMMDKILDVKKYWDLPEDRLNELPHCSNNEMRLCSWCGYSHVCPQMNPFNNGNYDF